MFIGDLLNHFWYKFNANSHMIAEFAEPTIGANVPVYSGSSYQYPFG